MADEVLVGISLGDPAGVGPEVALKACAALRAEKPDLRVLLAGSRSVAEDVRKALGLSLGIHSVDDVDELPGVGSALPLLEASTISSSEIRLGQPSPACAEAATASVEKLVQLALRGKISALACAPVNKEALMLSDSPHSGHSELIAQLCRAKSTCMFFVSPELSASSVTGHMPLGEVTRQITRDRVLETIHLSHATYREVHGVEPSIAVCSLDPHCGEGGMLGTVDRDVLTPSIREARGRGLPVTGPIPSDAVFRPAIRRQYTLVVAMYHDQVKTGIAALDSDRFVALLAGVPVIRTTTTHGTAFDITGKGVADPQNMKRAVLFASSMAALRAQRTGETHHQ